MLQNTLFPTLSLDGPWLVTCPIHAAPITLAVPGCWETQGQPKSLEGPVRYRRLVEIPADWGDEPIFLEFDAVSYAATVFCNEQEVGQHLGMWTPFAVDITAVARPGERNSIEVEVWKPTNQLTGGRYPLRTTLAGFLPDVATTFGGIWQSARLRLGATGFGQIRVDPDPESGEVRVQGQFYLGAEALASGPLTLHLILFHDERELGRMSRILNGATFDLTLRVPNHTVWSPATPVCYRLQLAVRQSPQILAIQTVAFGFRHLEAQGTQLLLNGQPICLRGLLSWGWNPQRIAPYYTADEVRAEFRRVRAQGYNLIKLCLFVPNQTYYEIADEEGMLLWQEWPMWLPEVTADLRARAPGEYADYMQLTRHHPSVVLYSLGCELNQQVDSELLGQLNAVVRGAVENVLICDNSGSGEAYGGLAVDFADFTDYHTYGDIHFLEATLDNWRRDWQPTRPWIFGEFCDADGFRDLQEIIDANQGEKPWWMTEENPTHLWRPEVRALLDAEERLKTANLGFPTAELVKIANAQSLMVRKYTLETVRKRAAVQGYVITGLRDTPIATSGVFDDFDRPKWEPTRFRQFNHDAILCLDVGRSRHWQHGGDRADRLDLYNWRARERVRLHILLNQTNTTTPRTSKLSWHVTNARGELVATQTQTVASIPPAGRPSEIGVIEFLAPTVDQATELQLSVHFLSDTLHCTNRWPLWAYPKPIDWAKTLLVYDSPCLLDEIPELAALRGVLSAFEGQPDKVILATVLDSTVLDYLQEGGKAILLQQQTGPLPVRRGPFWREAVKLMAPHPLWEHFPQRGYADMQFFGLATDVMFDTPKLTTALPQMSRFTPILRRLDAREFTLAEYLFEAQVGAGRLLACSLRLQGGAGVQPTGLKRNVAGSYLLQAMIDYLHKVC